MIKSKPNEDAVLGHDFRLEVTLSGSFDSPSGLIQNRDELNHIIQENIINPFHKKNISESFEWATGEVLAKEFWKILKKTKLTKNLYQVALQESKQNRFLARN